jgi:hypothetical protein
MRWLAFEDLSCPFPESTNSETSGSERRNSDFGHLANIFALRRRLDTIEGEPAGPQV